MFKQFYHYGFNYNHELKVASKVMGFTLVELVVVIAILGVLAATALPRFIDARSEAAKQSLNSLSGAVTETAQLWRQLCYMDNVCSTRSVGSVTNNGLTVQMYHGWPDAGAPNQIDALVEAQGFRVVQIRQGTRWLLESANDPNSCYVEYIEAKFLGSRGRTSTRSTGC